jgi:hypothetical protein
MTGATSSPPSLGGGGIGGPRPPFLATKNADASHRLCAERLQGERLQGERLQGERLQGERGGVTPSPEAHPTPAREGARRPSLQGRARAR